MANNISLLFTGYILHLDSFHFSDLARSKDNVKRALLQFQIQLKKSGRSDIYSLPVFLGFALEICRGCLPWEFAAAISRGFLPWEFAATISRDYLPRICFVYVNKPFSCVSESFFFVNKLFKSESKSFLYESKTFFHL